jgi:hypothetical protein
MVIYFLVSHKRFDGKKAATILVTVEVLDYIGNSFDYFINHSL